MEALSTYGMIIAASVTLILSFFFGEVARKTNVPSVLMLIVLGILIKAVVGEESLPEFLPVLKVLGTVGLIMIVLEAALELKLEREKYAAIGKALLIAFIGLMASTWAAAEILEYAIEGMDSTAAWLYATPLSILSSAIIIPSVTGLKPDKKEFHIYESTFSDILGIMLFYFLTGQLEGHGDESSTAMGELSSFGGTLVLTLVIAIVASYLIIFIFQNIRSGTKLFLLIAVLLLLYAVEKLLHLSALIVILIFGLIIANMHLFFRGKLGEWLHMERAESLYEGLHIITMETAFVVRTFFFVIFGISITVGAIFDPEVAVISVAIIASIYLIRYVILRLFIGKDINPQLYIAPRGLITILLFYDIPKSVEVAGFNAGILLFIIIGTSLIMTFAMIQDKQRTGKATQKAKSEPVGYEQWQAPQVTDFVEESGGHH